jgi:formate dehydrogenase maturation protein FdhE
MKVGDLIYDFFSEMHGIVVKIHACEETSSYMTVLYEDGQQSSSMRTNDPEVEVVSESR